MLRRLELNIDNDKNNKLISFRVDDGKLLETFKAIRNKIEDLKN